MIGYSNLCNASCAHCVADAGPHGRLQLAKARALECIEAAAGLGMSVVGYTGGEIFLFYDDLCEMMRHAHRRGMSGLVDTNGGWATSLDAARCRLAELRSLGLRYLRLSTDHLHQARVPLKRIINALRAANELDISTSVTVCYFKNDQTVLETVAAISEHASDISTRSVSPFGRAATLPEERIVRRPFESITSRCAALASPAVNQRGRVSICCAPPMYLDDAVAQASPLVLGWIDQQPLTELITRARNDPFLAFYAEHGPAGLIERLNALEEGFFTPRPRGYTGICDLCLDLLASPDTVARMEPLMPELLGSA
jgi:MoaA/NifB/PqqE/SkfB family radical SAM enzyme